jgi:type I restriction enzyme, S subunit
MIRIFSLAGLMQQLLTGKSRFKEFEPTKMNTVSLGSQLEKIVGGGTPSRDNLAYWTNADIPWITVKDLKADIIYNTKEYITEAGLLESSSNLIPEDTVIVATRMAVGKAVRCKVPATINQDLKALFPKSSLRSDFLHYMLNLYRQQLEDLGTGSTVKGIQLKDLRNLAINLPNLEEQYKIASVLSAADTEIETLEKQLSAYKQQKRGLMQQLLTGKKRVASPPSTVFDSGRPLSNYVERGENLA